MAEYGIGGGPNTFVPTFSPATGAIQIEFTRSVNSFAITQYAQIVPVQQMKGYFLRIDEEETARVVNTQDYQWPMGEDRPTGVQSDFEFTPYTCQRFQSSFGIPYENQKQSAWDIVASHARIHAQRMMTLRSYRAATTLTTSGNWTAGVNYFANASALGAGAYSSTGNVQKIIRLACEKIIQNTVGVVRPKDIIMIINPTTARLLAATADVTDYVKNYPAAMEYLRGSQTFGLYGLPSDLYGLGGVVVDDTVRISNRKTPNVTGPAANRGFFYGTAAAPDMVFVSRPGGLVGNEGPSFSTLSVFAYEDMTVETSDDPWNRRTKGSVVDNSAIELTAPLSGLFIDDIAA